MCSITPGIPPAGGRRVLIAVDGSEHSKKAFNFYRDWLFRPDDGVTLLIVAEPPSLPSFSIANISSVPTEEWSKILQHRAQEIGQLETVYLAECQASKINGRFLSHGSNHVGESIVKQAVKDQANLIVLGSRGLSAVRRTIMGSVSDFVLHHSDIPVCVIPFGVPKMVK